MSYCFAPQQDRNLKFNWQSFQKCDIEAMMRTSDLDTLESFLFPLQQGYITAKEYSNSNYFIPILKSAYILQLLIQYLEYTKLYQESTIKQLWEEEIRLDDEIKAIEERLSKSKKDLIKSKHRVSQDKKQLVQLKIKHKQDTVYSCLYCHNKAFLSIPLLDAHYQRHHVDKFNKPKNNQAETFLTVQTILLQQQINSIINNQAAQDHMMNTMQQTAFFQEQANESQSSESEDYEDVDQNDAQLQQVRIELDHKNQLLHQKLEQLHTYVKVEQPQHLLSKIDEIEKKLYILENRPVEVKEESSIESIKNFSYNAGPLMDDISEINDNDIYNQQNAPAEDLEEEQVTEGSIKEKSLSIIVDNQAEAQFLTEEREFHHIVKQVKSKKLPITKDMKDNFRGRQFDNELDKVMVKQIGFNSNEIQIKNEKELEALLMKLTGGIVNEQIIQEPEVDVVEYKRKIPTAKTIKIENETERPQIMQIFEDEDETMMKLNLKKAQSASQPKVQFMMDQPEQQQHLPQIKSNVKIEEQYSPVKQQVKEQNSFSDSFGDSVESPSPKKVQTIFDKPIIQQPIIQQQQGNDGLKSVKLGYELESDDWDTRRNKNDQFNQFG